MRRRVPARRTARRPSPRRGRGRRVAMALVLVVAAVAGITVGYLAVRDDASASVTIVPPALVVVDPATNRVVAAIPVGSRPAAVAGGVGCGLGGRRPRRHGHADRPRDAQGRQDDRDRVARRRPRDGAGRPLGGDRWLRRGRADRPGARRRRRRIPLGDPDDPFVPSVSAIGVGDGRVWAGTVDGLAQIDPAAGAIVRTVDLGARACSRSQWATAPSGRRRSQAGRSVSRRAPRARRRRSTQGTGCTRSLSEAAPSGSAAAHGLSKVDPVTAAALFSSRPAADVSGIAFGEGSVWVTSDDERRARASESRDGRGGGARSSCTARPETSLVDSGLVWVAVQRSD